MADHMAGLGRTAPRLHYRLLTLRPRPITWQDWDALPGQHPPVADGQCSVTKNPDRDCSATLPPYGSAASGEGGATPGAPSQARLTCRSMPMCFKIRISGRAPAFVAPTPLDANSYDDDGILVAARTDVAACQGFPLDLTIAAADDDAGDEVRIFVEDRDEDLDVISTLDLPLRDGSALLGSKNLDFFNTSSVPFPPQCAGSSENVTFHGYGAQREGDNMLQHHILALDHGAPKSIVSRYLPHLAFRPLAHLSILYSMPPLPRLPHIIVLQARAPTNTCTYGSMEASSVHLRV